jgi:hypothetical protein
MWLDREFFKAVQELYVPSMGTDAMAPFLYSLTRFTRARSVLEGGMGYTSPFIAKALSENAASYQKNKAALVAKTKTYLDDIGAMGPADRTPHRASTGIGLDAIYEPKTSRLAERRTEWMFADPALARPGYYVNDYSPRLHCVDSLSSSNSSARRVMATIEALGLADYVSLHTGDIWSLDFARIAPRDVPFDLMWIDLPVSTANVISMLRGTHWHLLNPNGGLLLIHCMLSTEGGQMLANEFKKVQQKRFNDFEFMGLLEPHRVVQNNVIMLRKVSGCNPEPVEKMFTAPGDFIFEDEARRLVRK